MSAHTCCSPCISPVCSLSQPPPFSTPLLVQLHIAAANGYRQVARLLTAAGADVEVQDDLGYTPLHVAARFNQVRGEGFQTPPPPSLLA